jgi:hypothetical protein
VINSALPLQIRPWLGHACRKIAYIPTDLSALTLTALMTPFRMEDKERGAGLEAESSYLISTRQRSSKAPNRGVMIRRWKCLI